MCCCCTTQPLLAAPTAALLSRGLLGATTSYDLPGSGTAVVSSLSSTSNVAIPGLWVYRVDGSTILSGGGCG